MKTLINRLPPTDWRDLQRQVSLILTECGLKSETDKKIKTVRGEVNIDVYAEDPDSHPPTTYLCECKHWQSAVPKTIVHAFRTVINDYGPNWGFIISSAGFQSGAYQAAASSNVRLLTWEAFQDLFMERWIVNYMRPRLAQETAPLWEYTEPINSRIFRKADQFDKSSQEHFVQLREKYAALAFLALRFFLSPEVGGAQPPELPLNQAYQSRQAAMPRNIPPDLLASTSLRDLVDVICRYAGEGIAAFDELFGGRA